jgi:hypothetical protein
MFGFQYKHHHFYHGDGEQWIMWDEMHALLKGGELGAQIICFSNCKSYVYLLHKLSCC